MNEIQYMCGAEFFSNNSFKSKSELLNDLQEIMNSIKPVQTTYIHKGMNTCSQVFVRNDTFRKSLTPPYDGPFEVIKRFDKYFVVQMKGKKSKMLLDRLKPAFMENIELCINLHNNYGFKW